VIVDDQQKNRKRRKKMGVWAIILIVVGGIDTGLVLLFGLANGHMSSSDWRTLVMGVFLIGLGIYFRVQKKHKDKESAGSADPQDEEKH
jgi:uncharacterized membrane protein YczE